MVDEAESAALPSRWRSAGLLFLASFLALYFELIAIRYLAAEIRVFAYLKNLPLIACFLGIGLGMLLGAPPKTLKRVFPLLAALLFLPIAYASALHLTRLPFPNTDQFIWGTFDHTDLSALGHSVRYFGTVFGVLALLVAFFIVWGGLVGQYLAHFRSLFGYGINLAGSLAGIAAFTVLGFAYSPPIVWIAVGFLLALPFFWRQRFAVVAFGLLVLAIGLPQPNTFWSPYYRITLEELPAPPGWSRPSAYTLTVNHDYHQRMVDLSPAFTSRYPDVEPNRSALATYELPFRLVENPGEVLIVGAGTGNDVAAALRHGAGHVDAVEIDPVILDLGRRFHPEHPYDSPRVTEVLDDARAFFKKTPKKYDLIVFGYLDSHTLLSGYSSLRLDNYVYTLESFQEARSLLRDDGTMVVAFAGGRSFVTVRLYATLSSAFGTPPVAYNTGYDGDGVVFVNGRATNQLPRLEFPDVTAELQSRQPAVRLATDRWPFPYLSGPRIPASVFWPLLLFLYTSFMVLRRMLPLPQLAQREYVHMFLLGAGFLLLETKGVTELSLLYGSTWMVNAVVITSFLAMGLLANTLIMVRPVAERVAYTGLLATLGLSLAFSYTSLEALPNPAKALAAAVLVGLPVFFSGLLFSQAFRRVARPTQALGVNLLGAVVGGTLENMVTIGGTSLLGILAILLYGLSAFFATRKKAPAVLSLPAPVRIHP